MDKLQYALDNQIFTDLKLTLQDDHHEITLYVHKIILYSKCVYFEKLLTNCKEKYLDDISISVPNAFVCHDIIMSFYGHSTNIGNLPEWQHLLETIICDDFMGIPNNILKNIDVPPEGFELLLQAVNIVGYDKEAINIIRKNVPINYDLSKLDEKLVNKIEHSEYKIVFAKGNIIKTWDPTNNIITNTSMMHNIDLHHVSISSDDKKIISASHDNNVKIWNAETGVIINTVQCSECTMLSMCISPDGKKIICAYLNRSIEIWNVETSTLINTLICPYDEPGCNFAHNVCISPDGNKIISAGDDSYIKIWDAKSGNLINRLIGHTSSINKICVSLDGRKIVSASDDHSIKIWDLETGVLINTLNNHNRHVQTICISRDNKKIISGSQDGHIKIWDLESGDLVNTWNSYTTTLRHLCISPDGKKIISIGSLGYIAIWDVNNGKLIRTLAEATDTKCNSICIMDMTNSSKN